MKIPFFIVTLLLFTNGVFGDPDEIVSVSVMEGDSLTLHTDITEIQRDHVIEWSFENSRIVLINKEANSTSLNTEGRNWNFRDHLQINNQTADLTIRNIKAQDSGLYEVDISGTNNLNKKFNVSCISDSSSDGVKSVSVMNRDSVILHTGVTEIKSDDLIEWRFGPQSSLIASFNKTSHRYNAVGGIKDRRHLNHRNGDLTIRHIKNDTSGLYEVQIQGGKSYTIKKSFNVTISDGLKRMSVKEGLSVTLWSGVKEIDRDDVILWWFEHGYLPIAKIDRKAKIFETYDGDDGRFKDRLEFDNQSGNLTIKDIKTEHSGLYHVDISSSTLTLFTRFSVTVCEESLHTSLISTIVLLSFLVIAAAAVGAGIYFHHMSPKARKQLGEGRSGGKGGGHGEGVGRGGGRGEEEEGDEGQDTHKQVTVSEGQSCTLPTDVTNIQRDDVIEWRFGDEETLIAEINPANNIFSTYDGVDDEFRGKLELNHQTGDLTINNISQEHTGVYTLKIIRDGQTSCRRFNVSVRETNGTREPLIGRSSIM